MQPDLSELLEIGKITTKPIGLYDISNKESFEPFVKPNHCIFEAYEELQKGSSIIISREKFGCIGAGYWLCSVETLKREQFVKFLAEKEGLKDSNELMEHWLINNPPYKQENKYIIISSIKDANYEHLKTITFYVNVDQLSYLITGAQYFFNEVKVKAPFASGCGQLLPFFKDLNKPEAIIGATDIAMRQYLPENIIAFTITKPMLEKLCKLDERSFLYKPFWKRLLKDRKK